MNITTRESLVSESGFLEQPPHYWTQSDCEIVLQNHQPGILYQVAMRIVNRIHQCASPLCLVVGPVTTGGLGHSEENLKVLAGAIELVRYKGYAVFNQLYFELAFKRYVEDFREKFGDEKYPSEIITNFYLPLIDNGRFVYCYTIEGWETSIGARMKYEHFQKTGREIRNIDLLQIRQYLA